MINLTNDYLACPANPVFIQSYGEQQLRSSADGRQRIAQLVGQHRQKFILAPVRFVQVVFKCLAFSDFDRYAGELLLAGCYVSE